jgi:hypothetical protein
MNMQLHAPLKTARVISAMPTPTGILQRKCDKCQKKKRASMEQRFAHDFSQVPVQSRSLASVQAKLTVGSGGDVFEQEADRVADQVLAAPERSAVSSSPPRIQRFSGQPQGQADTVPASVDQALASPGGPMEPALRQDMEQRFGHEFSRVRVHSDSAAEQSAREMNANAYTVGHNIMFGAGRFMPENHAGRRLLAHELTHVVQQTRATGTNADPSIKTGLSPSLIQRQEASTELAEPVSHAEWVVLKPPPVVQQQSLTCWAAALSSWLSALGTFTVSFQDIILRYAGKSCIEPDNSLPYSTANEVYAEWGAEFTRFADAKALTGAKVRQLLRTQGHLLFAQVGSSLGHVLVVYGSGFDEKGQPNADYISVMDPLSGKHVNRSLAGLSYPVEVGTAGKLVRPAPCLSKPGSVPEP